MKQIVIWKFDVEVEVPDDLRDDHVSAYKDIIDSEGGLDQLMSSVAYNEIRRTPEIFKKVQAAIIDSRPEIDGEEIP